MKHPLVTMSLLGLLGTTSVIAWVPPTQAANSNVETTLQSYGDTSMFYQALVNTGVINELDPNGDYTIFAPTNAAFAAIEARVYPCFYARECRPQIAAILRSHIIPGRHDLQDLVSYGQGIASLSGRIIHVREPYLGDFTVNDQKILSAAEGGNNAIYRIDSLIADPQQLDYFRAGRPHPVAAALPEGVVTEKVITQKTYRTAPAYPEPTYPSQTTIVSPTVPDDATETTTIIHNYSTDMQ